MKRARIKSVMPTIDGEPRWYSDKIGEEIYVDPNTASRSCRFNNEECVDVVEGGKQSGQRIPVRDIDFIEDGVN